MFKTSTRPFSREIVVPGATLPLDGSNQPFETMNNKHVDNKGLNKWVQGVRDSEAAKNKDYFDMLHNTSDR